jgi:hypothetical protein
LLLALAARLGAQALPDIGEAEISDVKLLLLDDKNVSRGTLTAKSAKKARDGKITIMGAVLKYTRDDGTLELSSSKIVYSPGADEFDAPGGFEANLPDGGLLSVPKGSASIATTSNLSLKATCIGDVHLRVGPEKNSPLDARLPDPVLEMSFGAKGRAESIVATGKRGAKLLASLSRLPSMGASKEPALLSLTCSSDVHLNMGVSEATLNLSGRVRGTLEQKQRNFALSCNTLRLKVFIVRSVFEPSELEAEGGARLSAEDLEASAAHVLLVESAGTRTATLTRDARARAWQEAESLEIQAHEKAVLRSFVDSATSLDVELEGSAHLFVQGQQLDTKGERRADWEIQGERVFCTRRPASWGFDEPSFLYGFDITGRGFAPLLSLAGQGVKLTESLSVSGKGAKGQLLAAPSGAGGMLGDITVTGPDVFVSALGPFHLVRDLRKALGLLALGAEPVPEDEPGRVVIRAQQSVRLNFLNEEGALKSMFASARSEVEIRQEPVIRNDRELCTLYGSQIDLDVDAARIGSANIEPDDQGVRATLGYDLLKCAHFQITGEQDKQKATLGAPGRVILRDSQTLAYLHTALSHLKVEQESDKPDAAWIVFAGESSISNGTDTRLFDFAAARLVFVRGDFVAPRSGKGAFDDLDELEESDVGLLYEARGEHLLGQIDLTGDPLKTQTLKFNLTLVGAPLLRSATDGLLARANEEIHIEAGELLVRSPDGERNSYLLGTVMRLGEGASIRFDHAARFFDDPGRLSGFSYDGQWILRGEQSLELRFAPAGVVLQELQRTLAKLGRENPSWEVFLARLSAFESLIEKVPTEGMTSQDTARVQLIRLLLSEVRIALRYAADFACMNQEAASAKFRQSALGCEARAFGLMGPEFQVAARGYTEIELQSSSRSLPPLLIAMSELDLSFSALVEITSLRGEGPVRVSCGRYLVSGKHMEREANGALTLDGARLTLPVEVGLEVEGVDKITVRATDLLAARVRVSGRQLKIKATLLNHAEKK